MNKKIKIAVIDSGIHKEIADFDKFVVCSKAYGINKEGYITELENIPVRNEHGTVVAGIIQYICKDIEFIDVNILDENLSTDARVLLCAISSVMDLEPDIIHMSLGTLKKRYYFYFRAVIREAKKKNILLVAAAEATGKKSYPAYLRGVFGVKGDCSLIGKQYTYKNNFFYAPKAIKEIPVLEEQYGEGNMFGTSMSAAYITGHLAQILHQQSRQGKKVSYTDARNALINHKERRRDTNGE